MSLLDAFALCFWWESFVRLCTAVASAFAEPGSDAEQQQHIKISIANARSCIKFECGAIVCPICRSSQRRSKAISDTSAEQRLRP